MLHVYFQTLLSKFASSSFNLKNKTEKCCRRPLAPNQPLLSNSQQAEDCTATVAITGNCACVRVCVCGQRPRSSWGATAVDRKRDEQGCMVVTIATVKSNLCLNKFIASAAN